jgi:hypothetical protein
MSIDTTDPRVRQAGRDYEVLVGGSWYLVEEDDRPQPPVWRAYTDVNDPDGGVRLGESDDPLRRNTAACAHYRTADELVDALLKAGPATS